MQFRNIIFFFLASFLYAQEFNMNAMPPPEISMEYEVGALKENSKVFIDVVIPENWHVNANIAADEFLKASSLEIAAKGIQFEEPIWPDAIKEYNEVLGFENLIFKGKFQIAIPVKSIEADYDTLTTNAIFHYQACDNSICLAPASVSVNFNSFLGVKKNLNSNASITPPINQSLAQVEEQSSNSDFFIFLLFAFLGGIILNLMPCVLPVLSLKLFSLIQQAGESRKKLFSLGCATTLGVLVSFWVLASIVAGIKISGGSAGWGMQFQNPGFIAFLTIILTAFAMSFFGVFEIWLPGNATTKMDAVGKKKGLVGAFFTGALLVLLSTPCSAPLLGTAMGFAFSAPLPILFLFFTAAGLGLSIPYFLISAFPRVLNILPKPGIWMLYLQKIMGVLLLATVAWLLWIVNEMAALPGLFLFIIFVLLSIFASFFIGKFAPPYKPFYREVVGIFIAVICCVIAWIFVSPQFEKIATQVFLEKSKTSLLEDGWYRYSPELVAQFANEKKTIFIDVTADWCITCKANEAAVLRPEFLKQLDERGVVRFKADYTRETPEVHALLISLKKGGVPAYVVYPSGRVENQIVLPEILKENAILKAVDN